MKKLMMLLVGFHVLMNSPVLAGDLVHLGPSYKKINFGVVVDNEKYSIYRSAKLGDGGLEKLKDHLDEEGRAFPKTIIYMNKSGYRFPFYFAVDEYKESIKNPDYGFFKFYHSFGDLRTYVDGENPYFPSTNIDSRFALGFKAKKYFQLQDDAIDGGMDTVMTVLELILNPKHQPVLFHCFGGLHRTGMMAMVMRYLQGGFWVDGPKVKSHDLFLNPAQFEYAKFNPRMFREENINFINQFSADQRFLDLKAKYGALLRDGSEQTSAAEYARILREVDDEEDDEAPSYDEDMDP